MLPVPFVGPLRSKILEKAGYTLEKLKNATVDELAKLDGFSAALAKNVIKYSNLVHAPKALPKELNFKEHRCPECGAIVSVAEPVCHKCGHEFFEHPDNYQEIQDKLADVIAKLYQDPKNPKLWREGEKLFTELGNEMIASDFKFKASSLELKSLETPAPMMKKPGGMATSKPGYTNGLVNGLSVNSHDVHKPVPRSKIRVLIIGLIVIAPVLMAGILTFGSAPAIVIDGHFGDWQSIPAHGSNSNEFSTFKMKTYGENTFIYVQGPSLFSTKDFKLGILIDQDSSNRTGFPVNRMGVDSTVWIYSANGTEKTRVLRFVDKNWESAGTVDFAISGHAIELKTFKISERSSILLYYSSSEGEWYSSIYTPQSHIWAVSSGGEVLEPGKVVATITLWNSGTGTAKISTLTIKNIGNATAKLKLEVGDISKGISIGPTDTDITLPHAIEIGTTPTVMKMIYLSGGKKYETLQPSFISSENFTFINRAQGAYISAIPAQKAIDGIFLDWQGASTSPRSALPVNVDLSKYASDNTNNLKIYMSVYGTLFGTGVPVIKTENGNGTGGNITNNTRMPENTLEIYVDSDKNPGTGFKIGNIGAEYRVLMYGALGSVKRIQTYRWLGRWVAVDMPLKYAKNANSIEIGLSMQGNVYYRLVNWEGEWDHVKKFLNPVMEKAKTSAITKNTTESDSPGRTNSIPISPKFVGKYNSTELRALFSGDVQVTTSTYDESRPSIVRTSDGTLWITYDYAYSATDHDLYIANSTDNGATWNVNSLEISTSDTSNPVITSDSADNIYIFFENHTTGAYFEFYKHGPNDGSTWYQYYISNWTWWSNIYNISAATYIDGTYLYIYVFFEYAYSSSDYDIGYVKYTGDTGYWWNYSDSIGNRGYWDGHPSVTISTGTNPKVFMAFDYLNTTSNKWEMAVINNTNITGTSWYGPIWKSVYYDFTNPYVYATGDTVYLAAEYRYYTNDHDIFLYNTTDNGATWNWSSWVNNTGDDERFPSVVASGPDVYVVFIDITSGYICEKNSTDYGQTWSNVNLVSDSGSGVAIYRTVYAYYYYGKVYVAWTDNRNGNDDIYFDSATVPELNPAILIFIVVLLVIIATRRKNLSTHRHARSSEKNVRSIQVRQERERD